MARMLKSKAEQWIVDHEDEAIDMIDDYKAKQAEGGYTVAKSGYTLKQKKSKGEVIDEHYVVDIKVSYE